VDANRQADKERIDAAIGEIFTVKLHQTGKGVKFKK
jgi:hypothetical protein